MDADSFLKEYFLALEAGQTRSYAPLLPLFKIGEDHMSTALHFQFAPFFELDQPYSSTYMVARQLGKTFSLSAQTVLRSYLIPGFHTLIIEPRADQLARYNATILRPLIRNCLIRDRMIESPEVTKFFIKEFKSGSLIYLEYCFLNPERVRGCTGIQAVLTDEAQDIDYEHLPVIFETTSASLRYGFRQFTGTPKTSDGTLAVLWNDGSKAEWVTRCSCKKWNVPSIDQDLLKMIGLKTCICAKCGKPLDIRQGNYVHAHPALRPLRASYHLSQVTHPMHYAIPRKWAILRGKMEGPGCYSKARFYNEVLGVPCDENVKLLSQGDLEKAASAAPGTLESAMAARREYSGYVMGVDWSGGGDLSDSYTAVAVTGFREHTDILDCVYAERVPMGLSPEEESIHIIDLFRKLQCVYLAHDFGGAGYIRESLMRQGGMPDHQLVPFTYVSSTSKDVIVYNPPTGGGSRYSYSIDKARSLAVLCAMIRSGKVSLPAYTDRTRLILDDLLALVELPRELPRGNIMYLIGRAPKKPDDFAHALNFACSAVWHTRQQYPDMRTAPDKFKMTEAMMELAAPMDPSKVKF